MIPILVVVAALQVGPVRPEVSYPRIWQISWVDASDSVGRTTHVPVFRRDENSAPVSQGRVAVPADISTVVRIDDQFRHAAAPSILEQILSDDFYESLPDGTGRNKQSAIQATRDTITPRPDPVRITARLATNAVVVTGEEASISTEGMARRFFTRVYVRDATGEFKLVSSALAPR
jgi:hypothetical protein